MVINAFLKANLVTSKNIHVMVFTTKTIPNNACFKIFANDTFVENAKIVKKSSNVDIYFFDLELSKPFDFAKRYFLSLDTYPLERIEVSAAVDFSDFDDMFAYDGDDLGSHYSKKGTEFVLWAPLSPSASVSLETKPGIFESFKMKREEKGVHRVFISGDYKNRRYHYRVENSGVKREFNDPYGIEVSLNSEYTVIVDEKELQCKKVTLKNECSSMLDSIIYEVNVRDFTEDKHTDIENKGKYLGFIEEGRKTPLGNKAGLDYLKDLGITHVQLQPIHDFDNVKDDNVKLSYNWGYDPISYFAIEGSYATHPEIAGNRIKEFQKMVNKLHENNIRVIVDVVYNHIYEYATSSLQKCVPNYFFRRNKKGDMCEGSGCGNEIASERKMARKLIVDSCKHLIKMYDIDGFRFDLMGLLDNQTMKEIQEECNKLKKDIFYYGEGWNIPDEIPESERPCAENAFKLPSITFFNDSFRDIIKGPNFKHDLPIKGYVNGDIGYRFGFDFAFHGSVCNHSYAPRYKYAHQSLNYVECHDNFTLFDKLTGSNPEEDEEIIYRRIRLANYITTLSIGVPFIHMGQEIGQSKYMHDNTYNEVKINNMDWRGVDERNSMVLSMKKAIAKRKLLQLYKIDDPALIEKLFVKEEMYDGKVVSFTSTNKQLLGNLSKIKILINPTTEAFTISFNEYWNILAGDEINPNKLEVQNLLLDRLSFIILYKV